MAWDPFALALLQGGLKPMPLARIDAVRVAVAATPAATTATAEALEALYGQPRSELEDSAELERVAARGWGQLDDEQKTEIKRVAKLLAREDDDAERAALVEEFGRLLGVALVGLEAVREQVCAAAQVEPAADAPAYAETLLDVQAAARPATPPSPADDAPLFTLRGLALSCAGLGLVGCLFGAAGAFGFRALGLGDGPAAAEPTPEPTYALVGLTPRDGLQTRARVLDVVGRVEPPGPRVVRVEGIRRRVGSDGRFKLERLGLEEGLNRIGVVVEDADGATLARADLSVSVDSLPPTLEVLAPAPGAVVFAEQVALKLRVADAGARVELSIGEQVTEVQPGEVEQTVKLPRLGAHRLTLRAVDALGNAAAPLTLTLVRAPPLPDWFTELAPEARPPLPLPAGLGFGPARGEYRNLKDGSLLVWVPAGRFTYGSDRGQRDERPARVVEVGEGFFVGKHEVTWGQYLTFCKQTARKLPPRAIVYRGARFEPPADHPVVFVTWADAAAYCAWAGLRLPTEVEWEYAAKGPEPRRFPWGDGPPGNTRCNRGSGRFGDMRHAGDGFAYTAPVGSFPAGASPFGCLDMAGNAMEWVADWYSGPGVEANRWKVIRGGSWRHGPNDCRASNRSYHDHDARPIDQCGFRVAR